MARNEQEQFLSAPEKVISILDGDQRAKKFAQLPSVYTIPIESVEKAIYEYSKTKNDFPFTTERTDFTGDKDFYNHILQKEIATQEQIFEYLIAENHEALQQIAMVLRDFLGASA